jgi:type I restriction enzyme R subunit
MSPPTGLPPADDDEDPIPYEPSQDETIVDGQPPDISIRSIAERQRKVFVDGVHVTIIAERVEYLDENGKLITESLRDFTRKALKKRFASLDEFLKRWSNAERKQAVIDELASEGLSLEPLAEEVGKDFDAFDLICHVAFDRPPLTRRERAENVRKRDVFTRYGPQARAVLEALLQKYQDTGATNLDDPRILQIAPFDAMGTPLQLIKEFGSRADFERAVHELQAALYQGAA